MPLTLKNFNRKLSPISNLTATAGDGQITLTWTDPSDAGTTTRASTKLVRKTGSAPSSSTDGTLVITETTRNQYSSSGYADTGLTNGTTYYYKAFVVDGGGNEIASNSVSETPSKLVHSDMQGPAPDGFHVPLDSEWVSVKTVWTALGGGSSDGTNFGIALKLPFAGFRSNSDSKVREQGSNGRYLSSKRSSTSSAYNLSFYSTSISPQTANYRTYGRSVRGFKDSPVVPDNTWTKLYGTSIEAGGIFWSSTDGLISLSSDGQTRITIQDKNLGATTVWNSGDTLSEANCGKYYQRGNNYGFPRTGTIANQSTTQVDASTYGPGNYYSSDTFIKYSGAWDSTDNGNLWGGVTQGTWTETKTYSEIIAMSLNNALAELNSDVSGYYNKFRGVNFVGQGYLGDPSITKIWNWFSQSYIDEIDMMSVEYDVIRYNQYASPAVFVKQSG